MESQQFIKESSKRGIKDKEDTKQPENNYKSALLSPCLLMITLNVDLIFQSEVTEWLTG